MKDLISVIVSLYNKENYINKCVSSILNQLIENIELIIVDDGSTDKSLKALDKLDDKRVKIFSFNKNKGVSAARNKGIKESSGNFITIFDADDIMYKNKLEREYKLLKRNGIHTVTFSNIGLIGHRKEKIFQTLGTKNNIQEGYIFDCILNNECFRPKQFLTHKDIYDDVGLYDENLTIYEDLEIKLRIAQKYPFYYTGITGFGYRQLKSGMSKKSLKLKEDTLRYIEKKYRKF